MNDLARLTLFARVHADTLLGAALWGAVFEIWHLYNGGRPSSVRKRVCELFLSTIYALHSIEHMPAACRPDADYLSTCGLLWLKLRLAIALIAAVIVDSAAVLLDL